jgi:hypothetical protein
MSPEMTPKVTLGTAHAITSAYADRQSKGRDRKDLPLETRIQFSHLHANALKFRACGARREVRIACGSVGEDALPSDIRLAAVTARMFDEYFTGWKPDREAHSGSLASYIEDLGGQTRLGVVLCAFDYPDGASRGDLSENGNRRCDWQSSSSRCQMQKSSTGKFHGASSQAYSPTMETRAAMRPPRTEFKIDVWNARRPMAPVLPLN